MGAFSSPILSDISKNTLFLSADGGIRAHRTLRGCGWQGLIDAAVMRTMRQLR